MTDRDDRQTGDRLHRSNSGSDAAPENKQRKTLEAYARHSEAATHHDPTDPEVPIAKRRGARRRRSSFVALATLITGLLVIALSLLYRASEKVSGTITDDRLAATMAPTSDSDLSLSNPEKPLPASGQAPKAEASKEGARDVLSPEEDDASAPASSSLQPKGDPPASDIIRTPAF